MTQSKAEQYSVAKRELASFLNLMGERSRNFERWSYPNPIDPTIDAARAVILAASNDIRRELLIIDARLNTLYDTELP